LRDRILLRILQQPVENVNGNAMLVNLGATKHANNSGLMVRECQGVVGAGRYLPFEVSDNLAASREQIRGGKRGLIISSRVGDGDGRLC
jgi:hypothetical protein